jgi:hypothetical protein
MPTFGILDLEDIVRKVWRNKVYDDYINGRIIKEEDLRSSFYHHIRPFIDKDRTLRVFLEKRYSGIGKERRKKLKKQPIRHAGILDVIIFKQKRDKLIPFFVFEFKLKNHATESTVKNDRKKLRNMVQKGAKRVYLAYVDKNEEIDAVCSECESKYRSKIKRCPECKEELEPVSLSRGRGKWEKKYIEAYGCGTLKHTWEVFWW